MTVILIAGAFVALVAVPVLVAIWPQRKPTDETSTRTAGEKDNVTGATTGRRG